MLSDPIESLQVSGRDEFARRGGIQAVVRLLREQSRFFCIRVLALNSIGLNSQDVTVIAEALRGNLILESLDFSGNGFGDGAVLSIADQIIAVNSSLKTIVLDKNNIEANGAQRISESLIVNNRLERISLNGNSIRADGAKWIGKMWSVNKSLCVLLLSQNNLAAEGTRWIMDALKLNTSLQELDISSNNIGDDGAGKISEALMVNSALQELDIKLNRISDPWMVSFKKMMDNHQNEKALLLSLSLFAYSKKMGYRHKLGFDKHILTHFMYPLLGTRVDSEYLKIQDDEAFRKRKINTCIIICGISILYMAVMVGVMFRFRFSYY